MPYATNCHCSESIDKYMYKFDYNPSFHNAVQQLQNKYIISISKEVPKANHTNQVIIDTLLWHKWELRLVNFLQEWNEDIFCDCSDSSPAVNSH